MRTSSAPSSPLLAVRLRAARGHAKPLRRKVAEQVNKKMVKLFGAGGFKGLPSYGTGIARLAQRLHPDRQQPHPRHSQDLRVHLYDGRQFDHAKVDRQRAGAGRGPAQDRGGCRQPAALRLRQAGAAAAWPSPATGSWPSATSSRSPPATSRCRCSAARSSALRQAARPARHLRRPVQRRRLLPRRHHQQPRRRPAAP